MSCAQEFVKIGLLLKPFGIKGGIKIHFYIDAPSDLDNVDEFYIYSKGLTDNYKPVYFRSIHFDKDGQFAKIFFEDIFDRTVAEQYRLVPVFIKKENLPSLGIDEYFIRDLLDLKVEFENEEIGVISNIISSGDRDIFIIQLHKSKRHIAVPFISRYILSIDLEKHVVVMSNLDELF